MSGSSKQKKIDELISKATESLKQGALFESERMAIKALAMARQDHDYQRMIRVIEPLRQARQQRVELAKENSRGEVTIVHTPITDDMKITSGCYLVQPPQVGADARRFRLAAWHNEVPVLVLCREPLTKLKMVPVVAISPGTTIRTMVEPMDDADAPDMAWFESSMDALGEWAISSLDPEMPHAKRIDALLDRLDALPECDALHDSLAAACLEAHMQQQNSPPASKSTRSKVKS